MVPQPGEVHVTTLGTVVKVINPVNTIQKTGSKNVIILCKNSTITAAQLLLLSRGLNFIPSVGHNMSSREQTQLDIPAYHRRIKLAVHFENR